MTWNERHKHIGPPVGWHWYRETPTSEPRRVKVFDGCWIKYAWPLGDDPEHPLTIRVEHLKGEFLGSAEDPERLETMETPT